MKRRKVLLSGAAAIVAPSMPGLGSAAQAGTAPDASRLNGDLTPLGAERGASASGYIPAWTGGGNTSPPGWSPGTLPPDPFPGEKPLFSITADNYTKYADMLCEGQVLMFKRFGAAGYRMDVYPCHRTALAPQYFYDNTAKNITRAQPVDAGLAYGFKGAFGGIPFPFLSDDPNVAGVQAMWNHATKWQGYCNTYNAITAVIGNGTKTITSATISYVRFDYVAPDLTPDTYSGVLERVTVDYVAPPNLVGGKFQANFTVRPLELPNTAFEYLVGEGRIREAPQAQYDIPESQAGDAINYDEGAMFLGALDRYTWTLTGKKEMVIPYNEHAMYAATPDELWGEQFPNPDLVRYEIHRCWVIEAHLAPGKRMTDPHRRYYLDEDTWGAVLSDLYDSQGNYWRYAMDCNTFRPDQPGLFWLGQFYQNFQLAEWVTTAGMFNAPPPLNGVTAGGISFAYIPTSVFEPQSMANSGGL